MDLSIRSYNTNNNLRASYGGNQARHSSVPMPEDEFEREDDTQEAAGDAEATPSVATVT